MFAFVKFTLTKQHNLCTPVNVTPMNNAKLMGFTDWSFYVKDCNCALFLQLLSPDSSEESTLPPQLTQNGCDREN